MDGTENKYLPFIQKCRYNKKNNDSFFISNTRIHLLKSVFFCFTVHTFLYLLSLHARYIGLRLWNKGTLCTDSSVSGDKI